MTANFPKSSPDLLRLNILLDDLYDPSSLPRIFTPKQKQRCWNAATPIPGRNPARWRYDAVGNPVLNQLKGCFGALCHEYDHIIPHSKGGKTVATNCQILQTKVNRFKSDRIDLSEKSLKSASLQVELTDKEMDLVEQLIYGSVKN